jgi:hypothetical protein
MFVVFFGERPGSETLGPYNRDFYKDWFLCGIMTMDPLYSVVVLATQDGDLLLQIRFVLSPNGYISLVLQ